MIVFKPSSFSLEHTSKTVSYEGRRKISCRIVLIQNVQQFSWFIRKIFSQSQPSKRVGCFPGVFMVDFSYEFIQLRYPWQRPQ